MQKIKNSILLLLLIALSVSCAKEDKNLSKITGKLILVDSTLSTNNEINEVISPYKKKMIAEIGKVISYTPKNLVRTDGNLQSSLGNLMADLCFEKADSIFFAKTGKHADFSMFNYGGIRAGIYKGKVTNKHVFELMPFENTLVVVEMTYEKIKELAEYFKNEQRAHPLSKHIQIILSKNKYSLKLNGKKLNPKKTYYVVTNNYLQTGGDRMYFFDNPVSLFESNFLIRDAIKSYFKSKDTLVSNLDNRVIIK